MEAGIAHTEKEVQKLYGLMQKAYLNQFTPKPRYDYWLVKYATGDDIYPYKAFVEKVPQGTTPDDVMMGIQNTRHIHSITDLTLIQYKK